MDTVYIFMYVHVCSCIVRQAKASQAKSEGARDGRDGGGNGKREITLRRYRYHPIISFLFPSLTSSCLRINQPGCENYPFSLHHLPQLLD